MKREPSVPVYPSYGRRHLFNQGAAPHPCPPGNNKSLREILFILRTLCHVGSDDFPCYIGCHSISLVSTRRFYHCHSLCLSRKQFDCRITFCLHGSIYYRTIFIKNRKHKLPKRQSMLPQLIKKTFMF